MMINRLKANFHITYSSPRFIRLLSLCNDFSFLQSTRLITHLHQVWGWKGGKSARNNQNTLLEILCWKSATDIVIDNLRWCERLCNSLDGMSGKLPTMAFQSHYWNMLLGIHCWVILHKRIIACFKPWLIFISASTAFSTPSNEWLIQIKCCQDIIGYWMLHKGRVC